jgi:hypothetical protein
MFAFSIKGRIINYSPFTYCLLRYAIVMSTEPYLIKLKSLSVLELKRVLNKFKVKLLVHILETLQVYNY